MAILKTEASIAELREHFGKAALFYELNGKKIMRSWPDRTTKKWIAFRDGTLKKRGKLFGDINKQAKLMLTDPVIKAEYVAKCKPGEFPFRVLRRELFNKIKTNGNR
jgi:hypothetical protein